MEKQDVEITKEIQVVVLMGGLGTRLGMKDKPKALADVNGRPFFDYQLTLLKSWGFRKFLFLVGYQAECIREYYGSGEQLGVEIKYSFDGEIQLGTGGALKNAEGLLENRFLLLYGDSFMDIDYQEVVYRYLLENQYEGKEGIMTILQNKNRYDKSNVLYTGDIFLYDKVNTSVAMQYIDYGVSMLSKSVLDRIEANKKTDLAGLLHSLSVENKLAAVVVTKRFYEIGTPESLTEFRQYAYKRFDTKQKAIFFDRDGVINEIVFNDDIEQLDSPFSWEEFIYKPNVVETLKAIQEQGYYIFIVTNQPAAAKGKVSLERLYELNRCMAEDLAEKGVAVEFVSMCPHHPKGSGRAMAPFLIGKCNCRKPKAGMMKSLLERYQIDMGDSFMVGDAYTDILAGKEAGLQTVFLGELKCDSCQRMKEYQPSFVIHDIGEIKNIAKGV